jgi:serine/threonine protein kinase
MEYCSRGSLATTYRLNPLPVDQVLRIGVRIASALESAHRLGIVHRDVKPANLLITDYGAAVLSDFGISVGGAQLAEVTMLRTERTSISTLSGDSTTLGLSVPWAPPEALDDEPTIDARSDVYSLGATLFTLLEGRSPFENPGGSNGALHLSRRIERGALVPGERVDRVPELSALLRRAMSVEPADRPQTALAFAEQLGAVERALGHEPTPIELLGDGLPPESAARLDGETTVLRDHLEREHETRPRPVKPTVARPERRRKRLSWIAAGALAVVVIAGGGTAVALQMSSSRSPVSEPTDTPSAVLTEPTPSDTPESLATEAIPRCPDAYIKEYYSLFPLFVAGGDPSPSDEAAIDKLHEPAILDAGISPYCGFGWHDGYESVVFEGTNAQAALVADALRSVGYFPCNALDDYGDDAYFECVNSPRYIAITTDNATRTAFDRLPIKHAFEVSSYRSGLCGDGTMMYCVVPW